MTKPRSDVPSHEKQPWPPPEATRQIRALSQDPGPDDFIYTSHAKEQLLERGLIVRDVLYVCQHGTVHEAAKEATRPGLFKYQIECVTPNSGGRTVRAVVIPDSRKPTIKIVTVMWVDGT